MVSSSRLLSVENVYFAWPRSGFRLGVSNLVLERGEKVLLVGPSGSGKSTLLSLLAGIVTPQRGSIIIQGIDTVPLSSSERDRFRAEHVGLVFQTLNLIPYLTALNNIVLPLAFAPARRGRAGGAAGELDTARRLLDGLGMPAQTFGRTRAIELSVGQQQRVAAARALIGAPALVIADEPTSALDADRRADFLDVLGTQLQRTGSTLLMVSHDRSMVPFFDRTIALTDIVQTERVT